MPGQQPSDHSADTPRRINFAFVGEPTAEQAAWLDAAPPARSARSRHQLAPFPQFRATPGDDHQLIAAVPVALPLGSSGGIGLEIAAIRAYATGAAFLLVARDPQPSGGVLLGSRINLSHRIMPTDRHRVVLAVGLADGTRLTNAVSSMQDAPGHPGAYWLYGGRNYSQRGETGAEYFLSPLPLPHEKITFTVEYPEIGIISPASATLDASRLHPTPPRPAGVGEGHLATTPSQTPLARKSGAASDRVGAQRTSCRERPAVSHLGRADIAPLCRVGSSNLSD